MKPMICILLCLTLLLCGCSQGSGKAYVPTGNALVMEGEDPDSVGPTQEDTLQEFTLAYYPDRSLNPLQSSDYTNRVLFSLIYQGLFSVDSEYNAYPILCSAWQVSADNRTYTFYIEESATFSDGTRLTINDVLATYQAAVENGYYKGRFSHVTSIELSGDGGIVFTMNTPYEDLPMLLDLPILKASEVDAERPLGTGPYSLEDSLSGAHLRRNMNWWCGSTRLAATAESIPLVVGESPSQIRDSFEFDDVGLVCADPCSDNYADFRCDFELWDNESGTMLFLACNVRYSQVFSNETIRAALTYAIDRATIVEENYDNYAKASTLAASPSSPYYSSTLASRYEFDPMKFIEALNQIEKPEDEIVLLVNNDDSARLRVAKDIAEMLTECGLPTKVTDLSTNMFKNYITNGRYDLYLGQTKLSPNMDLTEFFHPYGEMSWNGISDAATYSLCLNALANSGNYYDLLKKVADDGRIVPILFTSYAVYAKRGLMSDLAPSRDNVFFYALDKTMDSTQIDTVYE